ncbi:MAG: hypothetical protein ACRDYA_15540 [Egibacteraceae bacterium]
MINAVMAIDALASVCDALATRDLDTLDEADCAPTRRRWPGPPRDHR